MANVNYYLGPWVWDSGDPHWHAPTGTVGSIDLRALPDQALAGTFGSFSHSFFAVDGKLPSEYELLGSGDLRDLDLTAGMKSAWQSLLSYEPQGDNLVDALWDQLTAGADVTGATPTMPLVPTVAGNLELHLGGHSKVKSERFVYGEHPHTAKLTDLLHIQYRQHRGEIDAGRMPEHHDRRILDYWLDKYRVDKTDPASWKRLVPPELRGDHPGPLLHKTTITESWPTNGTTISSGQDLTWTETSGDVEVRVGRAGEVGEDSFAEARAESDLSSSDHYSQVEVHDVTVGADDGRPLVRFDSSARTHYGLFRQNTKLLAFKRVTGTFTGLDTNITGLGNPAGEITKMEINGSTFKSYLAGVEKHSFTDTAIAAGTRCGIGVRLSGEVDNFEAADLEVGNGFTLSERSYPRGVKRGVKRGVA